MFGVNKVRAKALVLTAITIGSAAAGEAYANCGCAPGETRYKAAVARAEALLQQNVKKTVIDEDTDTYHADQCWSITSFNVAEAGLGSTGTISWSSFPSSVNYLSSSEFSQAHQQALDWLIDVGYQGQSLVDAQLAINESYSNMQSQYNSLQSSHGGVSVTAKVKGRGRFTWKGREKAEGTVNVNETCVPDGFKSADGFKTLLTTNANLPPRPAPSNPLRETALSVGARNSIGINPVPNIGGTRSPATTIPLNALPK